MHKLKKMAPVIELKNLVKRYGNLTAVDNVSFNVDSGSLFGLLGPNGSGKTTIIKMLTGQIQISGGVARVVGIDVNSDPVGVRKEVGIIPEQESPPSFLTAEEYLFFVGKIRGLSSIKEESDWWFSYLDYGDKKKVLCKDLSRGTRQKLMFSQAFIHKPVLALIDEPLINFDPIMQKKVKDFLVSYVEKGNTIFLSTHILSVAEEICNSYAVLHRGHLLSCGLVSEITSGGLHLDDFFLSLVKGETEC